jgi:hypothetical protein
MADEADYLAEATKLVNDPRFRQQDPATKRDLFLNLARGHRPQVDELPDHEKHRFAVEGIRRLTKGAIAAAADALPDPTAISQPTSEQLREGAGAVAEFAGQTFAPRTTEQISGTPDPIFAAPGETTAPVRPSARAIARVASTLFDPRVALGMDPAEAAEQIVSTTAGRIGTALAADVAQFAAEWAAGAKAVRALGVGAKALGSARETALGTLRGAPVASEAAEAAARQAARSARSARLKRAATEGAAAGTIATIFEGVEKQEVPPLDRIITNPVAFAALGIGIQGVAGFARSNPRVRPEVAQQATQLAQNDPALRAAARDAQIFVSGLERAGISHDRAADLAFRAARAPLTGPDADLLRRTILRDPEILSSEFGEHIVRMQRSAFTPQLSITDGPLRATVEDRARRTSTVVANTGAERTALVRELRDGRLSLVSAEGSDLDVRALREFAPDAPPPPTVPDLDNLPEGVLPAGLVAPAADPGELVETPTLAAPEVLRETFDLSAAAPDPSLWRTLRDVDLDLPATPEVPGRGPVPERVAPGEIVPDLSARDRLLDGIRAQRKPPGSQIETPAGKVEVVRADDPIGPTIETPDGSTRSVPAGAQATPAADSIDLGTPISDPDPAALRSQLRREEQQFIRRFGMERGPDVAGAERLLGRKLTPSEREALRGTAEAAAEAVSDGKPATARDKRGRFTRVTPDPATNSALVVDATTNEGARLTLDDAVKLTLAGNQDVLGMLEVGDLLRLGRTLTIGARAPSLRPTERRLWAERVVSVMNEIETRAGVDIPSDAEGLAKVREFILSERGSVTVGGPRRPRPLPDSDDLAILGGLFNAKVFEAENGLVVRWRLGDRAVEQLFPTREAAEQALLAQVGRTRESARLTAISEEAAATDKIRPAGAPLDPREIDPALRVLRDVPTVDSLDRYVGDGMTRSPQQFPFSAGSEIYKLGPAGRALVDRITQYYQMFDRISNRDVVRWEKITTDVARLATERLGKERAESIIRRGFYDLIEKGVSTGDEVLDSALRRIHRDQVLPIFDNHYQSLTGLGVPPAPLEANYLPHVFDMAQLTDPRVTKQLVDRVIGAGRAKTEDEAIEILTRMGLGTGRDRWIRDYMRKHNVEREQAEKILDRFVSKNRNRRSAHLEFDRKNYPGYVTDLRVGPVIGIQRNARRLAEVQAFGVKDSVADGLIGRINYEAGNSAREFARDTFDAIVGNSKPVRLQPLLRFLYNINTLKLTFSPIQNIQQPINTMLTTNVRSFVRGMGWFNQRGVDAARAAGAISADMLGDITSVAPQLVDLNFGKTEANALAKALGTVPLRDLDASGQATLRILGRAERGLSHLENITLSMFNAVEFRNRGMATKVGEYWFDDLLQQIDQKGVTPRIRQAFSEAQLDIDKVLAARSNPALLDEMRTMMGLSISDRTQFRSRIPTMPLLRESAAGRFLFQFRTFSWNQASLIVNEIGFLRARPGKPADPARALRSLALVATVYPALGAVLAGVRGLPFAAVSQASGGETPMPLSSRAIYEALQNPSAATILGAYVGGLAFSGGLGIVGDLALDVLSRNVFSLSGTTTPVALRSIADALSVAGSLVYGTATADPNEFKRAARTGSRFFGGLGSLATQNIDTRPDRRTRPGRSTRGSRPTRSSRY